MVNRVHDIFFRRFSKNGHTNFHGRLFQTPSGRKQYICLSTGNLPILSTVYCRETKVAVMPFAVVTSDRRSQVSYPNTRFGVISTQINKSSMDGTHVRQVRLHVSGGVLQGRRMRRELRHQRLAPGHRTGQLGELAQAC